MYHQQPNMVPPNSQMQHLIKNNTPYDGNEDIGYMNNMREEGPIRLKKLEEINVSIIKFSQALIQLFDELGKDKSTLSKIKQILNDYIETLKRIENDLLSEINYLSLASTGQQHEGSEYGFKKNYDLARHRLIMITSQINTLSNQLSNTNVPVL